MNECRTGAVAPTGESAPSTPESLARIALGSELNSQLTHACMVRLSARAVGHRRFTSSLSCLALGFVPFKGPFFGHSLMFIGSVLLVMLMARAFASAAATLASCAATPATFPSVAIFLQCLREMLR